MESLLRAHLEGLPLEAGEGGVVRVDVDEGVDELEGGVGLVVHESPLPRHQLARRRLARARGTRQPEYPAGLLGLWGYVWTANGEKN